MEEGENSSQALLFIAVVLQLEALVVPHFNENSMDKRDTLAIVDKNLQKNLVSHKEIAKM